MMDIPPPTSSGKSASSHDSPMGLSFGICFPKFASDWPPQTFSFNIGSKVSEANYLTDAQSLVLNKLEIQRLSVSGVSLDEEMTHMIQYEQAYNAAAKLVSTVDEMIASILSIV